MKPNLSKVVVGVDGSAHSKTALQWACQLADDHGADVEALRAHAHPISPLVPALSASRVASQRDATGPRQQLRLDIADTGVREGVEETVIMRSPQFALEQASQDADLVVLGRTGRSKLQNLLVGSITAYCARHCSAPVAIIGATPPDGSVLVAVDGSDRSIHALTWALNTWPLKRLSVVYSHDESILEDLALDDERRHQLESRARQVLDDAVDEASRAAGIDSALVRTQIRSGDPRTTIVDALAPTETLLLGTQGHAGFAGWVLGSLADYALNRAKGAIIVWR